MFIINDLKKDICEELVKMDKNVLITGSTGSGKSSFCLEVAKTLNMKPFMFNIGSTQDARLSLVGSHELKNGETNFVYSSFVKAIQEPNSLIILDELSRGSDDAFNILFPLLDFRKTLEVDETNEIVHVAEGVRFIATANIGSEYSATRSLDRALEDRFMTFNLEYITGTELYNYASSIQDLTEKQEKSLEHLCSVFYFVNKLYDDDEISTRISPRIVLNCVGLFEKFSFTDVFDTIVASYFESEASVSSELNTVKMFLDTQGIY